MSRITRELPVIARHSGVWRGMFRRLDERSRITDEFEATITFRLFDDSRWPDIYLQTNSYRYADGRTESFDTPGRFVEDRIVFSSERVSGWSADDPLDPTQRNALLYMDVHYIPSAYIYEIAQLSPCGNFRTRMVQFIRDGRTAQRTMIDEELVTRDWAAFDREQGRT